MIKLAQELSRKREEQNPTRLVQFRLGVDVRIAVTSDEGTVAPFDIQRLAALVPQLQPPAE